MRTLFQSALHLVVVIPLLVAVIGIRYPLTAKTEGAEPVTYPEGKYRLYGDGSSALRTTGCGCPRDAVTASTQPPAPPPAIPRSNGRSLAAPPPPLAAGDSVRAAGFVGGRGSTGGAGAPLGGEFHRRSDHGGRSSLRGRQQHTVLLGMDPVRSGFSPPPPPLPLR